MIATRFCRRRPGPSFGYPGAVTYSATVRVFYPLASGRLTLRTEADWNRPLAPAHVADGGRRFEFSVEHTEPYLACKPCLEDGGRVRWAAGANKLAILSTGAPHDMYPHFGGGGGRVSGVLACPSQVLGRALRLRLYLPAGYDENPLKRYPVLYMHDGRNLFFPDESFAGEWEIDETLGLLDAMNLIDRALVVGVHAGDRRQEYTRPGYERYGRALVEELKPWVDARYRTLPGPSYTAAMGSSLGGVVSLFLGWQWPHVFGNVACLSSTFGYRDDLLERVRREPLDARRGLRIYLDSGWPGDNYEATLSMASALVERGFTLGRDLLHLVFPHGRHSEASWAARAHVPLQLFAGRLRRLADRPR